MIWHIIVSLALGALAGWIAGKIMKSKGGLIRNIIYGLLGSIVGGFIASLIGIYDGNWIGSTLISAAGACLCIYVARKLFK